LELLGQRAYIFQEMDSAHVNIKPRPKQPAKEPLMAFGVTCVIGFGIKIPMKARARAREKRFPGSDRRDDEVSLLSNSQSECIANQINRFRAIPDPGAGDLLDNPTIGINENGKWQSVGAEHVFEEQILVDEIQKANF